MFLIGYVVLWHSQRVALCPKVYINITTCNLGWSWLAMIDYGWKLVPIWIYLTKVFYGYVTLQHSCWFNFVKLLCSSTVVTQWYNVHQGCFHIETFLKGFLRLLCSQWVFFIVMFIFCWQMSNCTLLNGYVALPHSSRVISLFDVP